MIFPVLVFGQVAVMYNPSDMWLNADTDDFATIRQTANTYFEGKDHGRGSGYKQWKRWEYINKDRLSEDGKVINYAAKNWEEYHKYIEESSQRGTMTANGYWISKGPTGYTSGFGWNPGIGRINCITFHPTYTWIFWVGSPSGGLWKTTNGGSTWTPLTDGMPRIGVSGLAVNYNNTNIMYLLTGDGDGGDVNSIGVLKTVNGGETWKTTGFTWGVTQGLRAFKLIMHPTNSSILFVVSNGGIHKTTDAGVTWTQVKSGTFFDIEFKPGTTTTTMYACTGTKFYKSTNTGDTWVQKTSGVSTSASRTAIGVTQAHSSYVYLLTGPATGVGSFKGVYRSNNSGESFVLKANTPNMLGYSSTGQDNKHQTTYDLAIVVSSTDQADLMIGGINTWTSDNYGLTGSWTLTSMWNTPTGDYTHADIHALEINPLNNWLYCGSDGGIFRSTDFGSNWTDLSSGLAITQWYRIAGYESNVNLITGGTQDNGSNKWAGGSTMEHLLGADGMDCMIDHSNSNILYNSMQDGDFVKSTNGGTTFFEIQPSGSTGSWITPMIMNPSNSSIIYGGFDDIYKSTNGGSSWSNKGYNGSRAMAIGTNNTDRVYAAVDGSNTIYMSNDGGTSWTDISAGLPNLNITFIAVNPDWSLDVFVTFAEYSSGQKVYRSTNAGTSWTNISGTLPNIPVNCIAYEDKNGSPNDALYIGTDVGVYYRSDVTGDWIPFMNGLPAVMVFDLEINKTSGVITAGTYGRGLWRSALYSTCLTNYGLTTGNDPSNPNYTGFQYYEASNSITSSRTITGGVGTDVTYKADNKVVLTSGFHAKKDNLFKAVLGPCTGSTKEPNGIIKITGTFEGEVK